jgi:VanZ family protein
VWWTPILGHLFLFVVYGILVSVDFILVAGSNRFAPNIAVVLLAGIIWGLFTELYQITVPGRNAALDDLLIDGAGSILGGLVASGVVLSLSRNIVGGKKA